MFDIDWDKTSDNYIIPPSDVRPRPPTRSSDEVHNVHGIAIPNYTARPERLTCTYSVRGLCVQQEPREANIIMGSRADFVTRTNIRRFSRYTVAKEDFARTFLPPLKNGSGE